MSNHVDSEILLNYESALEPFREQMKELILNLFRKNKDSRYWHNFLIAYCAQGVHMTQEVPNWIFRAGEKAVKVGSKEFGMVLQGHAKHEAGHHELFIDDVKSLLRLYKEKFGKEVPQHIVPWNPPFLPVREYMQFHEDIINSDTPLRQVALEYEIEMLSVSLGTDLSSKLVAICGPEISECLTFVSEHVIADIGHTKFNRILLNNILLGQKNELAKYVETGKNILKIYTNCLLAMAEYAETKMS